MVHLAFLLASLGLVLAGQWLLLAALTRLEGWWLRRCLQLLGLAMPLTLFMFFALTMLPVNLPPETHHNLDRGLELDWLAAVSGFCLFSLPVLVACLWNLFRLVWLYGRTYRRTWAAPQGLSQKAGRLQANLRLWHSPRSFAFNIPSLWPGRRPIIVISTAMVEKLEPEELQAVIWHEQAHLTRRDFWVIWLANWWRNSFLYLPAGRRFFTLLQTEQELACDDRVVRQGGRPAALALAGALLRIWEETLKGAGAASNSNGHSALKAFEAPGLAECSQTGRLLTEQRVHRLIEQGQIVHPLQPVKKSIIEQLKTGGLLSGGVGLWLAGLEIIHIIMLPLGCAISLSLI